MLASLLLRLKTLPITFMVIAGLAGSLLIAGKLALHFHDQKVIALATLEVSEEARKEEASHNAFVVEELENNAKATATRVVVAAPTRRAVNAAPTTRACADSVAVRATLDGLREPPGNPRASPAARPAKSPVVRSGAVRSRPEAH